MTKYRNLAFLLLIFSCLLTLTVQAQDYKILRTDLGTGDLTTLDPALATDAYSHQIIDETYIGLTIYDEDIMEIDYGIASNWTITAGTGDTVIYTFTIRPNIYWVQYNTISGNVEQVLDGSNNPRLLTAYDIEYGWTRSIAESNFPDILVDEILNGTEYQAINDTTFEVTAPSYNAYQIGVYGHVLARPQPEWVINAYADNWDEPANFVSYGPYALKDWVHDDHITLVKNPYWAGITAVPQATIDELQFYFLDNTTAMSLYEAGNLDVLDGVPTSELGRIAGDPMLSSQHYQGTRPCTYYYGFTVTQPPFDNVHIRRAFSYALNRDDIAAVAGGGETPAPFFTVPSLAAAPQVTDYPNLGVYYDATTAQNELALGLTELGYASVAELPTITLSYNTGSGHVAVATEAAAQWLTTLGITVQLDEQSWSTHLSNIQNGTYQVWRLGWCNDYFDTNNFLNDLFHSTYGYGYTQWANAQFDTFVEAAAITTDHATRISLYAQAEEILVETDAAIIPLYWFADNELTHPYVTRTYSRSGLLRSVQRFEKWDIIPWDVNGDGIISPTDGIYTINRLGGSDIYADVDNDGTVTTTDVEDVLGHLGQ